MSNLRVATLSDLDSIVLQCHLFHETHPYRDGDIDSERIREVYSEIIKSDNGVCILILEHDVPVGLISGTATYGLCNYKKTAIEVMFWIMPEYRNYKLASRALAAFEYWATKIQSCHSILIGNLDPKVGIFYKRKGYELVETHYWKELTP